MFGNGLGVRTVGWEAKIRGGGDFRYFLFLAEDEISFGFASKEQKQTQRDRRVKESLGIMGELVISSTQELELRIESETHKEKRKKKEEEEGEEEAESGTVGDKTKDVSSNGLLVRWEKLFPKMVLRVLLVEADDSTRQIIAALLRKCSYRVVTVSDGLKAWEILKGRPHNIDLILTEADLPLISGYALLALIMEHEICKNIPVIMMSSQDSVSTVYKCMLRGAADYLVKPIRRNELRNLWQHVWRRQSSLVGGNSPQDESVGQDKVEATSENNGASNHSSGEMACVQRSKEYIEKGSDAQSSCTKPDLGAESARMENRQDSLQPIWGKFLLNNMKMQKNGAHTYFGEKLLMHENETAVGAACMDANTMTVDKDFETQSQAMDANVTNEACDNNDILVNSSKEAIDFMGALTNQTFCLDNVRNKFDSSPHLDLSLRRSHPGGFEIQATEERHTLRHSNASAFTQYTNRLLQPPHSTLASVCERKELGANSERNLSSNAYAYNSDASGLAPSTQRSTISLATGQTKESENATSCTQQRVFPIQIPVKGIRFNNLCTSYGSVFPPIFCKQSGASPLPSPSSASHLEPASKVNLLHQSKFESKSERLYDQFGQDANDSTNRTLQKQDHRLDCLEDRGHISPATDQSATSSFCNGAVSHLNSLGYGSTSGSNSNADQVAVVRAVAESKNEGVLTHNTNPHRSVQREAALTKFRLKRKDRCYEKKVRYESRKKLAEQRPRVKGQFVRQVHNDPAPAETD